MYHSNWQAIRQHCGLHKNLLGMLSSKDNAWLTPAKLLPNIKIWKTFKVFFNVKFADDCREHYVGVHFVNPIPIDFSNLSPSNHSFSSNRAFHIFSLEYEIETRKQSLKFHGCYFFFLDIEQKPRTVPKSCLMKRESNLWPTYNGYQMLHISCRIPFGIFENCCHQPPPTHKTLVEMIFSFDFQANLHSPRFCLSEMGHIWNAADFGQKALFSQMSF